jgi:hypothetical protein
LLITDVVGMFCSSGIRANGTDGGNNSGDDNDEEEEEEDEDEEDGCDGS